MTQTKTSSAAPKPAARATRRPAVRTAVKKAAPVAAPAPEAAATEASQVLASESTITQTKKVPRIKTGQNWACEICSMAIVVDDCGCIEDHVFLCCGQEMNRKKNKKANKKKSKKKK